MNLRLLKGGAKAGREGVGSVSISISISISIVGVVEGGRGGGGGEGERRLFDIRGKQSEISTAREWRQGLAISDLSI